MKLTRFLFGIVLVVMALVFFVNGNSTTASIALIAAVIQFAR